MPSTRSRRRPARRVPQIALNWLLQRPTVATVIIGARNEEQLRQNLGAVGWKLTPAQIAQLDAASEVQLPIRTGTSGASPSGIRSRYSRTRATGPFLKAGRRWRAGDACASL